MRLSPARPVFALVLSLLVTGEARAQTGLPGLLRDIATPPQATYAPLVVSPVILVPLGSELFFGAWDPTGGLELRATDGTAAGTRTVADLCPGSCHGFWIIELVELGGVLYFVGDDGVHGRELWRSDGTTAGTAMVADLAAGLDTGSDPEVLTPTPAGLFFTARDAAHGRELWLSDGTAAGTHRVADLWPGAEPTDSSTTPLGWLDGHGLVFAADDGTHGRELWLTTGAAGSAALLADSRPGPLDGVFNYAPFPGRTPDYTTQGGRLFFSADDGVHGFELWSTDGTPGGTGMVEDLVAGASSSTPGSFHAFGSAVLFRAGQPSLDNTLWRSDGTAAGTYPLGDAAHGSQHLVPNAFAELGGLVYFPGHQAATGRELWRTDGTLAGTQLAVDVLPGPAGGMQTFYYFVAAAGRLWFTGTDGVHGTEWWQSDGTAGGTFQVADVWPGAGSSADFSFAVTFPAALAGRVLFSASDPDLGMALRAAEPGMAGTTVVQAGGERPGSLLFCALWNCLPQFVPTPEGVAFGAYEGQHGLEPWRSDATDTGTALVAEVAPGLASSLFPITSFRNLAPLGDDLLLIANDCVATSCESSSVQLWRATPAGGLTKLTNEAWSFEPGDLVSWDGAGYFAGEDAVWKSDGTVAGTGPLGGPAYARWFTASPSRLYFVASPGQLWRTDGTPAGTTAIAGPVPAVSSRPVITTDAGGAERLYFAAADATAGNELWVSDGTEGGAHRVVDLRAGAASAVPTPQPPGFDEPPVIAALGPRAFFAGDDGVAGEELWVSDGSPGNATLLEVRPGAAGSEPRWVTAAGGRVYFVADDGSHGREPWVTDGTPAGTHLLADVRPGAESSTPRELTDWMGRLVFAAADAAHGMELWRADVAGTAAGLVADLRPGVEPSSPQGLTALGERLYFFADDGASGLEPWVWSAAAELFADGFESGGVARWSRSTPP